MTILDEAREAQQAAANQGGPVVGLPWNQSQVRTWLSRMLRFDSDSGELSVAETPEPPNFIASEVWSRADKGVRHHSETGFTGADCTAHFLFPGQSPLAVRSLTSISVSSYREKVPVRTLGMSTPKAYARGGRTVGGTIVFTCEANHPLASQLVAWDSSGHGDNELHRSPLPDMLPPFTILLAFTSEQTSSRSGISRVLVTDRSAGIESSPFRTVDYKMPAHVVSAIYGVELLSDSMVVSVDDMVIEVVANYVATTYRPISSKDPSVIITPFHEVVDRAKEALTLNEDGAEYYLFRNRLRMDTLAENREQNLNIQAEWDLAQAEAERQAVNDRWLNRTMQNVAGAGPWAAMATDWLLGDIDRDPIYVGNQKPLALEEPEPGGNTPR